MRKFERITALVLVLLLVIATNVMDNTSFTIVKNSVSSIFDDRLVAYDLTYKMHNQIMNRQIGLLKDDQVAFKASTAQFESSIENLIDKYAKTNLTSKEAGNFEMLQTQFEELKDLENQYLSTKDKIAGDKLHDTIETQIAQITETLNTLAAIQIKEGRRLLNDSNRAVNSSKLLSKIEIISMIIIAMIIIFMIVRETRS